MVLTIFLVRLFVGEKEEPTASLCPEQITYQGDVYKAVEIGEQCWLAENLRTSSYRDGTAIPKLTDSAEWAGDEQGAYTGYNNQRQNCDNYGALYNWHAVNNEKGLCPEGWSVPTQEQWAELERTVCQELGYQNCQEKFPLEIVSGWRGTDEGLHLRAVDLGGKDSYGFKALFGGFRNTNGSFGLLEENGFWWTSTDAEDIAYGRAMGENNEEVYRIESLKLFGFSVRCVKD